DDELEPCAPVKPWAQQFLSVPLQVPPDGKTPDNKSYNYSANDASVGDLDGDGQYEIIVKWYPSNAQDNAFAGYTGNTYLDAYKLDGTRLWRIDLGRNIRSGAHYTQFQVFDYDGDGKAEMACKTADGTIDGQGNVIGDPNADWRAKSGYVSTRDRTGSRTVDGKMVADLYGRILSGPEYLTVFSGLTGEALSTTDYVPLLTSSNTWGDTYGNRSERYLAGSAFLGGETASILMGRGYYSRLTIAAWDFVNGELKLRWFFDSDNHKTFNGQGNHNLSVGDVDFDGKDEVIYGSCAIDDDGSPMYSTGLGHGDAMHLGDLDPDIEGLEVWQVHESSPDKSKASEMHDARTGKILKAYNGSGDVGRGMAADIDGSTRGQEMWSSGTGGVYSCTGKRLSGSKPSINFRIYWDGDVQDELLDGTTISKWTGNGTKTLMTANGCASNNGSKNNPMLTADIFGDWREEVIYRTSDSKSMRIYTTVNITDERLYTLMHDPIYRMGVAWQNTAYNQPPHLGFYLGDGASKAPTPNIELAGTPVKDIKTNCKASTRSAYQKQSVNLVCGTMFPVPKNMSPKLTSVNLYSLSGRMIGIAKVKNNTIYTNYHLPLQLYIIRDANLLEK
ncbi:MAG: rhamnogalacturonan lyase, partial [Fibrobacter sp.]|nr:rhamnogalacturonan lyase [Fibrobacter sp.]